MRDTTEEIAARYREMLLARSSAERFIMGARMFDTARALVLASLPRDLEAGELRRRLFARIYAADIARERVPPDLR
jgi:hypothetical protein